MRWAVVVVVMVIMEEEEALKKEGVGKEPVGDAETKSRMGFPQTEAMTQMQNEYL